MLHYLHTVHHDGSPRYVSNPYPRLGETVRLRLRMAADAPVNEVLLRTTPDGENKFDALTRGPAVGNVCWWTVDLVVGMPVVNYRFLLVTEDGVWWYNGLGLHEHNPTDYADFKVLADYQAPHWVRDSVFYQIFPDRFADGDPTNNVRTGEWMYRDQQVQARAWGEQPGAFPASIEFYGGDLQGIRERLPYLADLGVNALYLNPIFTAPSVHRYDVVDYNNVDPHLGGNAALVELREALSDREMYMLLDIVPNHCGVAHPWFTAAQADPNAPTSDYFIFTAHPNEYASWLGVRSLPKLDYRSQELRDVMYRADDAVFRRWMQAPYSIDGWRVDVANMLGRYGEHQLGVEVVREMRQVVKREKPDAYLLAENFFDATPHMQGDEWDANMNYSGFSKPLWQWLGEQTVPVPGKHGGKRGTGRRLSTDGFVETLAAFRAPVPWVIAIQQFNLVDSHDTARVGTIVGDPQDDPSRQRVAAAIQLTYPGVPCIYYGDEIGMQADSADMARATMVWDEAAWDHDLRHFYRALIYLRRTSPALRDGGFQVLFVDEDTLAYLRDAPEELIIVIAHRGPAERPSGLLDVSVADIPDGTLFTEVLSGVTATVGAGQLPLPRHGVEATIWLASVATV